MRRQRRGLIGVNFDDPLLSGPPGSVLTFTGTMTNNTGSTVFLNSGSVNLASPFDTNTDVSGVLDDWPWSLDPSSTSADFVLFTVTIPDPFPGSPGSYGGTLLAQGGADENAMDDLNVPTDASFAVNVTGRKPRCRSRGPCCCSACSPSWLRQGFYVIRVLIEG